MSDQQRQTVAQGVIAVAVCLGGYVALVGPARDALARASGEREELALRVRDAEVISEQSARLSSRLDTVRREATSLQERGALARDERRLYAAIVAASEACGVGLDQLNPSKTKPVQISTTPDPRAARDAAVAYSITATGTYEAVATFLRALQNDLGVTVVRSVSVGAFPGRGPEQVRATIDTVHCSFDPAPGPAGEGAAR
jgi:hypothetical protein